MAATADLSTRDLNSSRIKLADELVFAPQSHGREIYCHIESPSQGKFYRVGYPEYVFLSLLDGNRSVAQALTITARTLGPRALTQPQGLQAVHWLLENGLAQFAADGSSWAAPVPLPVRPRGQLMQRLNPFWMKLPLGSPDPTLAALAPALSWLFSMWASLAGLAVIAWGVGCVLCHWGQFVASAAAIFTPHNWLWLALAWLGLKVVHELSHALACKFYRGEVRETGLIFILFAPLAYVDVTSCWRFPSKWQRIHVAAAGMYAELLVAAVAAITWTSVESTFLQHLLFNVIVMASLSTILFNANPLMRFDGYYMLSDLLEIPNLASEGSRFLNGLCARVFFGEKRRPLQLLGFRGWCVRVYGVASAAWRLLVCFSLVTAASVLLHGAGLILAVVGVLCWFGPPLWRLGADLQRRYHEARPSLVRGTVIAAILTAATAAVLLWAPWPGAMKAPVVVDYCDLSVVRSRAAGFVQRVHVIDGQTVTRGQLLVELRNDELEAERRELELAYQQQRVRRRIALDEQNGAEAQITIRNLQAIEERLKETRRRSSGLQVRAPVAGRIVARNIRQSVGTYIKEGEEILAVGDDQSKELVVSVGQEDAISLHVGEGLRFRVGTRPSSTGTLERLEPRASTALPHPAMSACVGGPLAVAAQDTPGQENLRLVEPRFRGVIRLSGDVCHELGAGEQGYATLGLRQESIGQFVWVRFRRWCESILRPAHG